jgi:N-acylneuraminate cytidylyltransferase
MPTVSVYVPARLNSQRLPRKALRDFNGQPLVTVVLEALKQARTVTKFCVNTESDEIARVVRAANVGVYPRAPELAQAETATEEILADFASRCDCDFVAAINPTNPLLTAETIDRFFTTMFAQGHDTAFSVSEYKKHVLMDGVPVNYSPFGPHPRTQDVTQVCMLNWAIVAWRTDLVQRMVQQRGDSIYLGRTGFIPIPALEAVDIDDQYDFDMAVALARFSSAHSQTPATRSKVA